MMRVYLFIICFICFEMVASGQTISSRVIDTKTGQPIAYVNIGIVGENIGTVSNEDGVFELSITDASDTDTLRFSMISYLTKEFTVADLRRSGISESIMLDQRHIELSEVVVAAQKATQIKLGLDRKHCYPIPLYKGASSNIAFPQEGYRHEIGTRYSNTNLIYLDSIQLNFAASNADTLEFRLNVYAIENEIMSNILVEPIYILLSKKEAENFPIIDLSKYQIEVESDFLVTIENYKHLPGGSIKIMANFKAKGRMYPTYYRSNSQSNWVRFQTRKSKGIGLSFVVFAQ